MKLIIEIPEGIYLNARTGYLCESPTISKAIENGKPYDKVIDEVTELLEYEWGYEGMRDDVVRIMKGGDGE